MRLEDLFGGYNDKKTKIKVIKIFGMKFTFRKFMNIRGKILRYELPNHLEGRYIYKGTDGNEIYSKVIKTGKPAMLARLGGTEMNIVKYFYDRKDKQLNVKYPKALKREAKLLPGIFSAEEDNDTLVRFSSEVLDYLKDVDVLAVWNCFRHAKYYTTKVQMLEEYANPRLKLTDTEVIVRGMFAQNSWTKQLKGKKVLVISPFTETIKSQYEKRKLLFKDEDILPDFDLKLIKAPQGIGENNLLDQYRSWFSALKSMEDEMDRTDYDILLVGAGAYGFHLAHHAKEMGKIGIHVAGALQLLFGIKGGRWTGLEFVNEHWVSPSEKETPKNNTTFVKMEGSNAYW